ncbi:MAG: glycosyltransferase family 2 protein [Saprospiraceae bacterium]|nr:glycosyltransferase family 2 protein [Bacteroidia bacterium]NNE14533.1 glycosyltransferase family 2 protein [Saprospiraceae bacterium]NNL91467.1 glycosyltransferase family 2 protein [Saprospiraceae bacterium]
MKDISYSILVPLFNESDSFQKLIERLSNLMDKENETIEVVLVDDGSSDNTFQLIEEITQKDERYRGVKLSRNFGHQLALTAGMSVVRATKAVMVIDGDLQDPPEMFFQFKEKIENGYDIAVGVRATREASAFYNFCYKLFYRLLNKFSYTKLTLDSGDFAMITRRVVNILNDMPEQSRYLRGLRSWVGFKEAQIPYDRDARAQGESKYSFGSLIKLAYEGFYNFSWLPIRLMTYLGLSGIILCSIYVIHLLYLKFTTDIVPTGFTATIVLIVFIGCLQFLFLGILGEYIVRTFAQVKNRPLFIIEKIVGKDNGGD